VPVEVVSQAVAERGKRIVLVTEPVTERARIEVSEAIAESTERP
jgi:hypothetical protein